MSETLETVRRTEKGDILLTETDHDDYDVCGIIGRAGRDGAKVLEETGGLPLDIPLEGAWNYYNRNGSKDTTRGPPRLAIFEGTALYRRGEARRVDQNLYDDFLKNTRNGF